MDIENGFMPDYGVIRGKGKVIATLKKAAETADAIYLAPDPDREGEAIAWHIAQEIAPKKGGAPMMRVMIHEITKKGVEYAIQNPLKLNEDRYNAQQARRILDRLVGYQISPILWRKVKRGLSAGRVQSVALRLVVEREAEIRAFKPEEYWNLKAWMDGGIPPTFLTRLVKIDGKKAKMSDGAAASAAKEELSKEKFRLVSIEKKSQKRFPSPPFITSTLQREASLKLRFTTKKTMMVAQRLYEGVDVEGQPVGLITYMRTDSTRLSGGAVEACREFIASAYGSASVPEKPNIYQAKKNAQDAHEAVRPTSME
ncbi:type I DNA topoisomerase, partial [bacterium]